VKTGSKTDLEMDFYAQKCKNMFQLFRTGGTTVRPLARSCVLLWLGWHDRASLACNARKPRFCVCVLISIPMVPKHLNLTRWSVIGLLWVV